MKKAVSLFLALLLTLCVTVPALALEPSEAYYVTDETGLLSQDTVDKVLEINAELEAEYAAQIVVVFVDYFGDVYADEYAISLFNDWQLADRGMLLVVSPKEGRGGMTVGSEITDLFTVNDINTYLDRYFWDDFDAGKYDRAVTTLVSKLYGWYQEEFRGTTPAPSGSGNGTAAAAGVGFFGLILGFLARNLLIILVFVLVIVAVIVSDRRRWRGYHVSMGMPIPRYYPWYMFTARPYRRWRAPPPPPGPRGPRGPGGPGGFGGGGGYRPPSRTTSPSRSPSPRPGRSGGSFGGRSGRPSGGGGFRSGGGGHIGGGHSGGSFGGRR